jgi:hypothetical protein
MSSNNIFSALAKYNSATDENYLTESFVFVINTLLKREPNIVIEFINHLCSKDNECLFNSNESIFISTQDVTQQGTPDIKISFPEKFIYIEVKHESDLGYRQIERYKQALASSSAPIKYIVLLTRYSVDFKNAEEKPDKHVRWSEVYNWLETAKDKAQDRVNAYLIEEFMSFLEVKQMSIQKVGWEYINGVPALNNLMNMIESAIEASGIRFFKDYPRSAGWEFKGFWMEDKQYWCGVHFNNPTILTFEITDKENFNEALVETNEYKLMNGKERLWFRLPLEDVHFFSLDKDKQLEEITKFVKTSYAEAQKMRIP